MLRKPSRVDDRTQVIFRLQRQRCNVLEGEYRFLQLEEGLHQVDNAILTIDHRKHAPLVEGEAWMRNVEADHVTGAKTVLG